MKYTKLVFIIKKCDYVYKRKKRKINLLSRDISGPSEMVPSGATRIFLQNPLKYVCVNQNECVLVFLKGKGDESNCC